MFKIIIFILVLVMTVQTQMHEEFEIYLREMQSEFDITHITADSVDWSNVIVLDSREKEEFSISHIKDARWIGYEDFELSRVDSIDRNQDIIIYCSVGYRSSKIAMQLIEKGFRNVKNLYGGIFGWANQGRPLYRQNTPTRRIHAYDRYWRQFLSHPDIISTF